MFGLLDPIRAIHDDLEEMVDKATPRSPGRATANRDGVVGDHVTDVYGAVGPELARLTHKLSETLTAVSAAADCLHDIAEEQAQVRSLCVRGLHCILI